MAWSRPYSQEPEPLVTMLFSGWVHCICPFTFKIGQRSMKRRDMDYLDTTHIPPCLHCMAAAFSSPNDHEQLHLPSWRSPSYLLVSRNRVWSVQAAAKTYNSVGCLLCLLAKVVLRMRNFEYAESRFAGIGNPESLSGSLEVMISRSTSVSTSLVLRCMCPSYQEHSSV